MFCFLSILFIDIVTAVISSTQTTYDVKCVQHVNHMLFNNFYRLLQKKAIFSMNSFFL